ncbi:MAG TPA: beta-N-acetylhexosaminidase [Dongiaceae bacterium]|nr:beta-N-acetylhexosaminidase [Dongiaceae bacterium]
MTNAVIFGCAGPQLEAAEAAFFRATQPLGFILFARNVVDPAQLRRLTTDLRAAIGKPDAPVLIDQEGGRVRRLKPPHWRDVPAPGVFGALAQRDRAAAERAVHLNHRLVAAELIDLGITVDCAPLLDLRFPGAHDVVGDRSFGGDPDLVADLGRIAAEALLAGGVMPVIKHIPGHGRALVDSHLALPRVAADRATLAAADFRPFVALKDLPWGMTAHLVYEAIDATHPATLSKAVIGEAIRGEIGFDGLLLTDDLSMKALGGSFTDRAAGSLAAGCDIVLHCNGDMDEMRQVAAGLSPLSPAAKARYERGQARLRTAAGSAIDPVETRAELDRLIG